MKMSKGIGLGALLVAVVLLAVIFAPSINASVNKTKSEKALEHISQKHGIPKEQLMITNEMQANFPLSNQKIWSVKILDPKTKKSYLVDLDEADNIADIKAVKALEYARYREKYGKKEIELHEKLQKMNLDDMVEVGIWLSPIKDEPKPEREINEKEYKEILDAKRKVYAEKEKSVLDILKAKNINIRYASQFAPLIYAQVPVKLMPEVENIPEIEGIYLSREFKPSLDKVAQTLRIQPMWNESITGNGINVAVVEHGKIMYSHPNLTQGSAYNISEGNDSHATQVAGIIASNHSIYRGISYGVPGLISANFGNGYPATEESRAIAASEWAVIEKNADILSNSWNNDTGRVLSGIDKYFDHVVWSNYKTVIVSAGNDGETTGNVKSPGLGYNVITVGGFEDNGDSDWSNDVIWAGSSYKNPVSNHGDREKPEVAAVATHGGGNFITTLQPFYPWIGQPGAGTSYAAPAVAAEAALLMQANSWLKTSPEAVKAIIMASAVHNIEGDSRLSDKDGAGGIDILSAYNKTNASEMILFAFDFPKNITFNSSAGEKVRVVIVWDSHPDSNHPPVNDDLQSDLDLYIYDPSGVLVNKSVSYDNSYEIVEFTAPATGTYNAQIYAPTFGGLYEYVGIARTALPSLSGWNYAKVKTITGSTAPQTNYQMKLTVYKGNGTDSPGVVYLGGSVKDDFGDLRFTKSDGVTLLDYWIESYTSGVSAVVWVEVDSIPASPGTVNIYLYYGNPNAVSASSFENTIIRFYDDFNRPDSSTVGNGWTEIENGGTCSIESNMMKLQWTSNSGDEYIQRGIGVLLKVKARIKQTAGRSFWRGTYIEVWLNNQVAGMDLRSDTLTINSLYNPETQLQAYNQNSFYDLEMVWKSSNKIDFYVDGLLKKADALPSSSNAPNRVRIYQDIYGSGTSFTDWVEIYYRNYVNPEPTWGS